jgi:acyl-homoserine lactone synthase
MSQGAQAMVEIVTPANRSLYRHSLDEMHRFRYDVAVNQWGWKIPGIQDGYDKDDFDTEETIYFLSYSNGGDRLVGCARLNSTSKPHMLSEVFSDLCDLQPVPRDPSIYEYSRYIIDHQGLSKEDQFRIRGRMTASINRFCLEVGINALTWFAYQQMYPRALKVWDTKPLGVPKYFEDDKATYVAAISRMTQEGLCRVRDQFNLDANEPHLLVRQPWDGIDPKLRISRSN